MSVLPKKRGRPPLAADAVRSDKKVRAVRLSDHHWAILQAWGTPWLESVLDHSMDQLAPLALEDKRAPSSAD